ncbi:hypothetical protein ACIOWI_33395 [Streptomyces sp. NPDC087659]|uniref:hypothetical protein n=1 Tax=Streptomyces sp. NPDC087659 TaxID=3365801 RepID=UPI00382895F2
MAIEADDYPGLNDVLLTFTGGKFLQANEDLAFESSVAFRELAAGFVRLAEQAEQCARGVAESLPEGVRQEWESLVAGLTGDGPYSLRAFAAELKAVAEGRAQISMQIMESKVQVIVEALQLLAEIAVVMALAAFAWLVMQRLAVAVSRMCATKLAAGVVLVDRTRMVPVVSEGFQELFSAFMARMFMVVAAPKGRRQNGFDGNVLVQSFVTGMAFGGFHGVLNSAGTSVWKASLRSGHGSVRPGGGKHLSPDVLSTLPSGTSRHTDSSDSVGSGMRVGRGGGTGGGGRNDPHAFLLKATHAIGAVGWMAASAGTAETLAAASSEAAFTGKAVFDPETFLGGAMSAVSGAAAISSAEALGTGIQDALRAMGTTPLAPGTVTPARTTPASTATNSTPSAESGGAAGGDKAPYGATSFESTASDGGAPGRSGSSTGPDSTSPQSTQSVSAAGDGAVYAADTPAHNGPVVHNAGSVGADTSSVGSDRPHHTDTTGSTTPLTGAGTPPTPLAGAGDIASTPTPHTGTSTEPPTGAGTSTLAAAFVAEQEREDVGMSLPSPPTAASLSLSAPDSLVDVSSGGEPVPRGRDEGVSRLERAWAEDASRLVALFGAVEDTGRAGRIEAWQDFTLARDALAREVRDHGGRTPGSGPSDATSASGIVGKARRRYEAAARRLAALGLDPARVDQEIAKINTEAAITRGARAGGASDLRVDQPDPDPSEHTPEIAESGLTPTVGPSAVRHGPGVTPDDATAADTPSRPSAVTTRGDSATHGPDSDQPVGATGEEPRLSSAITDFGTARDGSQGLVHIAPVPEETVEWLQRQVIAEVERRLGEDPDFREAVRKTLTSRFLTSEWARIFSEYGLPLHAPHRGRTYRVALRLSLSEPRPVSPEIEEMPDGPPVNIQRWVFGVSETGEAAGSGDLRSMNVSHAHTWPFSGLGWFRRFRVTPQFTFTHNQTTTSVVTGATVQPMVLLRSRERSWRHDYTMNWQIRTTDGLAAATTAKGDWRTLEPPRSSALSVWFPQHLVEDEPDLGTPHDGDPEKRPASLERLLTEVPLLATESVPHADRLFADLMLSFGHELKDLSEASLEELLQFFGEGNLRGNMPLMCGGSHTSPTLYAKDGSVIGMLRVHADLSERTGQAAVAGPPSRNSVLEAHVLRSLRLSASTSVANAAGFRLGFAFGFAAGEPYSPTGTEPFGFTLTGQGGAQHQAIHTLGSGGSARTSHSLRTARPLIPLRADAVYRVDLVRPDGPPRGPAPGSPLAIKTAYPVILRVPSAATVAGTPQLPRYLPPEVLHLRSLGVSTTPLSVDGAQALFDNLETWLRDHGFLPAATEAANPLYRGPTEQALRVQRLNNLRKLEQIRSIMGLRAALDEMAEGGHTAWFELPMLNGTQRASFRIEVTRRYTESPSKGVTHDDHLTGVQTLNYTGSTIAGEEQLRREPWTLSATGQGTVTNAFDGQGDLWLQGLTGEYTYSRQSSVVTGASSGSGHEFYALSPTADGIQLFTLPVTFSAELSWSHGPAPEPDLAEGTVSLALPTYRTLAEESTQEPSPEPRSRAITAADPHTPAGAVRMPETALLDRVEGSRAIRRAVDELLDALAGEVAAQRTAADTADTGAMPGGWTDTAEPPEDPLGEPPATSEPGQDIERRQMPGSWPEPTEHSGPDDSELEAGSPQGSGSLHVAGMLRRSAASAVSGGTEAVRWVWHATHADGAWQWARRLAVGERVSAPDSLARNAAHTGFSSHHIIANAYRIFRDSYVVEGVATSGVLAGTDVTFEIEGFLTDVKRLPSPGVMDYERWVQSVDAAARSRGSSSSHTGGVTLAGDYGGSRGTFAPSATYLHRRTTGDASTVTDQSMAFRVTSENDVSAHRFSARAVYKITMRAGLRNSLMGMALGAPRHESTRIVEIEDALEFLLSDNDLINHPEFITIGSEPPLPGPRNRLLPAWFVRSDGQLGYGSVVEVHLGTARSAFQNKIKDLVDQIAPGVTMPGHPTYLTGVLSRINEHGSSLGLRTAISAGPYGRSAFHFVYRSWLGPRLVEVAMTAKPIGDLHTARGRFALKNAGLDTVLGHTNGDGSALSVPGTTRQTHFTTVSNTLEFSPLVQHHGHRFRPTLSMTRQSEVTQAAISTRERRAWQRSMLDTSEFELGYRYDVIVTSMPMEEVLAVAVAQLLGGVVGRIGQWGPGQFAAVLYRQLPQQVRGMLESAYNRLPAGTQRAEGRMEAQVVLRFNGSQTHTETAAPPGGTLTRRPITPTLYTENPAAGVPGPREGEVRIDMESTPETRKLLSGEPWIPQRPFTVYDYDGITELAQALRSVDPSLGADRALKTPTSSEGMFIRLTQLASTGRLSLLEPAATAPYLGQPGASGTSMQLLIYAPHSESESLDTAIDRVEISTDGSFTRADLTMSPALTMGYSGPWSDRAADRSAPTVPLAGERTTSGQTYAISAPRREMLRFGTPLAGAEQGAPGHTIQAVGVLRVDGPKGTRWVTGNIILRTTETPPSPRADASPLPQGAGATIGLAGPIDRASDAARKRDAASAGTSLDDHAYAVMMSSGEQFPSHEESPGRRAEGDS